jgi:murein DD-endopeptidase MepM/ murein hydrolase activator NlpD
LIYPGGRTKCRLLKVAHGNPNIRGGYYFPFSALPGSDWTTGMRRFGANRSNGTRAHAGCDLYFPAGTDIYAMADGLVIDGPSPFYAQTHFLTVEHGRILVRYGEIQATSFVQRNQRVAGGQKIARVGHLVGINVPSDMLHLEMYSTTSRSALTVNAQSSKLRADGVPFLRRNDLMDPTTILNQARSNLPRMYVHQPLKRGWVSY